MNYILETKRLQLREFTINDATHFYQLNLDDDVIKYTGDVAFSSINEARIFLENYTDYKKNGFGRWAVISKETGEFLGWCGLKLNEENLVDLGYRFYKKEWGKGYATESAKACLHYGFKTLNLDTIIARTATENVASVKVLEKLGMQFYKLDTCDGIQNAKYYKLDRNQFLATNML